MKAVLMFVILLAGIFNVKAQYKPVDDKSEVNFTIKNFGINTGGSLKGLKGSVKFDPSNLSVSSFNVSVDVNTINTGVDARDSHIKKEEYFNVAKYPAITFVSTKIGGDKDGYNVGGTLTIKGVSKPISFPFTIKNEGDNIVLSGNFTINRKDFGVGGSSAVLGNSVDVNLKIVAEK